MKYLVVMLALLSITAFAFAETKPPADDSKPLEIPDFSKVKETPGPNKAGLKVHLACKTTDGHVYKYGEPGYDSCTSQNRLDEEHSKIHPHDKDGSTMQLEFGK